MPLEVVMKIGVINIDSRASWFRFVKHMLICIERPHIVITRAKRVNKYALVSIFTDVVMLSEECVNNILYSKKCHVGYGYLLFLQIVEKVGHWFRNHSSIILSDHVAAVDRHLMSLHYNA